MEVCHHVDLHSKDVKRVDWAHATKEDYETFGRVLTPQIELYGKTCGIFGLGAIGFAFAKMAQGFGMRVISYSRHKKTDPKYDFIEQVDFDTLLAESDVISIHAPLTPSTEDTFDADAFAKMKDGTILINTARGGLIVEEALVDALQSGKVYGAGLDVIRMNLQRETILCCIRIMLQLQLILHGSPARHAYVLLILPLIILRHIYGENLYP